MENKLILKDGTEIVDGKASKTGSKLMIRVPGDDIVQATLMFTDHEKTEEIVCISGIHKTKYLGFTNLYSVQYFSDMNYVEIWLKGDDVSMNDEIIVPAVYVPYEKPYTPEVNSDA